MAARSRSFNSWSTNQESSSCVSSAADCARAWVTKEPELVGADGQSPRVVTALHVPLDNFEAQTKLADKQTVVLELVVRVAGPDGRTIKNEARTLSLKLGADDLRAGFSANFAFAPGRAGFYRISVAARDTVSGRTGSATRFIAIARAKPSK